MTNDAQKRYDAFISYSHGADSQTAAQLQRALQGIAKPVVSPAWYARVSRRDGLVGGTRGMAGNSSGTRAIPFLVAHGVQAGGRVRLGSQRTGVTGSRTDPRKHYSSH